MQNHQSKKIRIIKALSVFAFVFISTFSFATKAFAAVTISGTVYTDEGSTAMTTGPTVRVKVNGAGSYSAVANGSGVYSIGSVTANAGDVVTVYLDGATEKATMVTRASGADMSSMNLYQNFVIVRSEDGSPLTNTNMDSYDSGNDADINFTVTTGALTVLNSNTLYMQSGTYSPGGDVTAETFKQVGGTFNGGSGALNFRNYTQTGGTFNSTSGVLTVGSSANGNFWTHTAGGTFNHNNGTVKSISWTETWDFDTSETFYNFERNVSGGNSSNTLTIASGDTLIVTNTLTLTDGAIDNGTVEARGNVVVAATADGGTSPITLTGSASQTITNSGGTAPTGMVTINKTNASDTVTLASNYTFTNGLVVTKGIFDQGASYNYTTASTTYIGTNGTWSNTGTGDVVLGGNVTNAGIITLNSNAGSQCTDGTNDISITSSSGGVQRTWSGAGTFNLYNLAVTDMLGALTPYNSTMTNSNWSNGSSLCGASNGGGGGGVDGGDGGGVQVNGGSAGGGSTDGGGDGGGGGTLPQTFTAADGTNLTTYDSNWTVGSGQGGFGINTNALVSTNSGRSMAWWSPGTIGNDQYAEMTIPAISGGSELGVAVRVQSTNINGYAAMTTATYSGITRFVGGVGTVIYSGAPFSPGDIMRLEVSGTTLTLKRNGVVIGGGTDSTYSTGRPGVYALGSTNATRGDNWSTGSISSMGGGGGGGAGGGGAP